MLFHWGHFDRNEISCQVTNVMYNIRRNEIIQKETSVHANFYQNEENRSRDQNKNEFHFILLAVKTNVNNLSQYKTKFYFG